MQQKDSSYSSKARGELVEGPAEKDDCGALCQCKRMAVLSGAETAHERK